MTVIARVLKKGGDNSRNRNRWKAGEKQQKKREGLECNQQVVNRRIEGGTCEGGKYRGEGLLDGPGNCSTGSRTQSEKRNE